MNTAVQSLTGNTSKILLVEDDADLRMLYGHVLQQHGYTIMAVSDARTALRELSRHHYDLVLTDYQLPQMSGGRLIQTIHRWKKPVPILLMSAHPSIQSIAEHFHADGYYNKGDGLPHLMQVVASLTSTPLPTMAI